MRNDLLHEATNCLIDYLEAASLDSDSDNVYQTVISNLKEHKFAKAHQVIKDAFDF
jgi:hypothetical protein